MAPSDGGVVEVLSAEMLSEDSALRMSYPISLDLSGPRFQIATLSLALNVVRAGMLPACIRASKRMSGAEHMYTRRACTSAIAHLSRALDVLLHLLLGGRAE